MQELELNYPTTKGKIYSEEEDRYLLCRLNYYGIMTDDVYERIKQDITEFPVFRFDWFFKSRTQQELQQRCNTLLTMIEKETEGDVEEEAKEEVVVAVKEVKTKAAAVTASTGPRGKKRAAEDGVKSEKVSMAPTPSLLSVAESGTGIAAKRPSKKKKM